MQKCSKVAMLSYNTFLRGHRNGWIEEKLFLIQNDNGSDWGAPQFAPIANPEEVRAQGDSLVRDIVGNHWQQLSDQLSSLDRVVIYVGDRGSENTIKHAAAHGLNPDKAMFVLCGCNMSAKQAAIASHGFSKSRRIMCECGGHATMRQIAERFLATGDIA